MTRIPPTIVTYPEGAERGQAIITALPDLVEGATCVITDRTPFHPLDPWWPDQPSDRGVLIAGGRTAPVSAAVVVGVHGETGQMRLNEDKSIKRSDASWAWHIGHIIPAGGAGALSV